MFIVKNKIGPHHCDLQLLLNNTYIMDIYKKFILYNISFVKHDHLDISLITVFLVRRPNIFC